MLYGQTATDLSYFEIKSENFNSVRAAGSTLHYSTCSFSLSFNFCPYRSVNSLNSLPQHAHRSDLKALFNCSSEK